MNASETFQLACQCLILDEHPELIVDFKEKFISGKVDLFKFIHLCSNHLVLPAIYLRLKRFGLVESFPEDFTAHLNEIYTLNLKRNKEILNQIAEINHQLLKEQIEPVYLKGTANLIDNLYSHTSERMIGDIDVLVKEKDYFVAADLIQKLGYKQDQAKIFDELNTLKHFPRLFRNDVPADVEIHRLPVHVRYAKKFINDDIFKKKKIVSTSQNCFVACNEHKLVHTFIHSQLSNNGYSFRITSLRDLYDFYLLTQKVDFKIVLPGIEEKKKAEVFFNLVQRMFAIEKDEFFDKNMVGKKYYKQFNWFLNHPKHHRFYINIKKSLDIFIERPFAKIKNAFLNKTSRKSLIKRLKNPDWYKTIYIGIKSYFK